MASEPGVALGVGADGYVVDSCGGDGGGNVNVKDLYDEAQPIDRSLAGYDTASLKINDGIEVAYLRL